MHLTVEPTLFHGACTWRLTVSQRRSLDVLLHRMIRRIMNRRRGPDECWLEWWRRTGRLARESWQDVAVPWSTKYVTLHWQWGTTLSCMPDISLPRLLQTWRDSEWTAVQVRELGPRRHIRPVQGRPWRWEDMLHKFWTRRGWHWSAPNAQHPPKQLWWDLKSLFVARFALRRA